MFVTMANGLFITGTGTGVGKTVVAAGIAACLRDRGIDVGVLKPVETGCARVDGRLTPVDALFLKQASGSADEIDEIAPYVFEAPLAPSLAAEREGRRISVSRILGAFQALSSRHDMVIVESAGGLMAPLTGRSFYAGLAARLGLPAIVVAGAHLGTINHTLLTIQCAERAGIRVIGVVMDHVSLDHGPAEATNAEALRRWVRAPFLGELPFLPVINVETVREAALKNLDIERILNATRANSKS